MEIILQSSSYSQYIQYVSCHTLDDRLDRYVYYEHRLVSQDLAVIIICEAYFGAVTSVRKRPQRPIVWVLLGGSIYSFSTIHFSLTLLTVDIGNSVIPRSTCEIIYTRSSSWGCKASVTITGPVTAVDEFVCQPNIFASYVSYCDTTSYTATATSVFRTVPSGTAVCINRCPSS